MRLPAGETPRHLCDSPCKLGKFAAGISLFAASKLRKAANADGSLNLLRDGLSSAAIFKSMEAVRPMTLSTAMGFGPN
jgi:hypothetical protein